MSACLTYVLFPNTVLSPQAGEYIDMTVGVALGISTMAAAALGNTISDVAGVGLGGIIESVATRLGLPPISLSRYALGFVVCLIIFCFWPMGLNVPQRASTCLNVL